MFYFAWVFDGRNAIVTLPPKVFFFLFGTLPMGIDGLHVGSQTKARLLFDQGVELAFKKMLVRRFFAANNHVDQFFLRVGQSFVVMDGHWG